MLIVSWKYIKMIYVIDFYETFEIRMKLNKK